MREVGDPPGASEIRAVPVWVVPAVVFVTAALAADVAVIAAGTTRCWATTAAVTALEALTAVGVTRR